MFGYKKSKASSAAAPAKPDNGVQVSAVKHPLGNGTTADSADLRNVKKRAAIAVRNSLAFAQIVSVLMRSPHFARHTLADLQWLVLPPLMLGNFRIAEAKSKQNGVAVPVAVAVWASVSAEVDKRLSDNLDKPVRLRPNEWRSGDILWLLYAVGDTRVMPEFMKQLGESTFKGRKVKVRKRGQDGKPTLGLLGDSTSAGAPAA